MNKPLSTLLGRLAQCAGAWLISCGAMASCWALSPESIPAAPGPGASWPGRGQIESRLNSTATLINSSSAAQQIDASQRPDALQRRQQARLLLAQAMAAMNEDDMLGAVTWCNQAARTMFEAVRLAAPEQVRSGKERADFDARLDSTRALLDAHRRIATEKGQTRQLQAVNRQVEPLIEQARQQVAAGEVTQARAALDQAYGAVRASIQLLRGGDTLVRSLNFASKAEEFSYELDRNDTHRMLMQLLLRERAPNPGTDQMIEQASAESLRLRQQAQAQAARQQHADAVLSLEASTRELVRAIRAAGVYIPG